MHNILQDIVSNTEEEVVKRMANPVTGNTILNGSFSFKENILNPKIGDIGFIAEIKLSSPSEGKLGKEADFLNRVREYQQAGADAISIITENRYFSGNLELVTVAKKNTQKMAVLQKDFVIDGFQIEESRRLGADALLLIARIVSRDQLTRFVKICLEKGIEPVVEICNIVDLKKAINSGTNIIAVNARDLDTFKVSVKKACKLLTKVPEKFIKLGFSGVCSRKEVEQYKQAGAQAVLVGTELMKAGNISKFIKELKNAG